ncbi:zinc ribbon domain-containing protein [Bacillus sp. FSL K6-3431]|uniref:zinc ribbon domain-containing protein n=1 Tax=Bacillus sp. FSL K6-3431 TaxID=2921500 RepID=UPI0030FD01C6
MQTYCQSCSMPMIEAGLYGTEANGNKSKEYCMYCYEQGAFLQSDVTMEEMIDLCTGVLTKEGMKEEEARRLLRNSIPYLNRWRQADLIEPTYIIKGRLYLCRNRC